jgi:hypothetical protein
MARGPERLFEARGGRLAGRPDHFDGHILTEYKSALPDPAWPGAAELLNSFRRQVRLYAAIIADAAGTWPTHGRVVSASGHVLELASDPAACDAEADAAVAALDALNRGLLSEALPERLAQPSQPACTECPFQTICPAFWRQLGADGMQGLPDVAIEAESASDEAFASAGRAQDQDVVVLVQPTAAGEGVDQAAVETARGAVVDILEAGCLAQPGKAQALGERGIVAFDGLAIDQHGQALVEAEAIAVGQALLLLERLGHAGEA